MMRTPILIMSSLLLACTALAACGDDSIRITTTREGGENKGVLKVVDTLQCPQTQGSLTRKGTARAGGTVCVYAGPRGSEVTLHLQPLNGASVDDVLKAFEDRLSGDMPETIAAVQASAPSGTTAASGSDSATVEAPGVSIQAEGDTAEVKVPGLSIDADGDRASIRIGGVTIDANDSASRVNIEGGPDDGSVNIQAAADGALIRTRAAGDATRATWLVTDGQTDGLGWRLVGYEARGPAGGPLVIAVFRAKETDKDPLMDDARALLTLNVGE
ncbi:methyltransferase type 11 [Brevundimonas sp.]|uniref:methyltransferase type 11 n=1 Tax=Brevundimonas sp. TaxID=1871086 RepID=UPI003AF93CF8